MRPTHLRGDSRYKDAERQEKSETACPGHPKQGWGGKHPAVPARLLTTFAFPELAFLSDNSISF